MPTARRKDLWFDIQPEICPESRFSVTTGRCLGSLQRLHSYCYLDREEGIHPPLTFSLWRGGGGRMIRKIRGCHPRIDFGEKSIILPNLHNFPKTPNVPRILRCYCDVYSFKRFFRTIMIVCALCRVDCFSWFSFTRTEPDRPIWKLSVITCICVADFSACAH